MREYELLKDTVSRVPVYRIASRTQEAYLDAAGRLARLFEENFASRHGDMEDAIADAGPRVPR